MTKGIQSGWYYYRNRVPHPDNKTIDEMNRRLFLSLCVEATNEENEDEHVDDRNDSVSLDTQPDEHMNWLFYGVCFMNVTGKSSEGLVILWQHQG